MQHPKKRPSVGYKSDVYEAAMTNPVQAYRNDTQSFQDLLLWMDYTKFPVGVVDSADYVKALYDRGYFTAKPDDYLRGLNAFITGGGFVGGGGKFGGKGASGGW